MAVYDVEFASSAGREFRSLPIEVKQRVAAVIDRPAQEPRPPGVRKLSGHQRLYRIRVGRYRIVYEIDDGNNLV